MRYKRPDNHNARSMIDAAKREIKYTLSLKLSEESASTIVRNIYEAFRMLGDALLVAKGTVSTDHIMAINELLKLNVNARRHLNAIDNLRRLRHNVNYYGYRPTLSEAKDAIDVANELFMPVVFAIEENLQK